MSSVKKLTSSRPYFLRALNEWMVDNDLSPHIVIDSTAPGVGLPEEHLSNDAVVFNISPESVKSLRITNKLLTCNASFSGQALDIMIPVNAILQIFAKENGVGMGFDKNPILTVPLVDEEMEIQHEPEEPEPQKETTIKKRGHLRLVKSDKSDNSRHPRESEDPDE